jgi:rRNA maturation endonuclease Nob1
MADPKEEEKIEKKVEETSKAAHDNELTDADIEKVSAGSCVANTHARFA